jgi:hypothetical protein
MTQLERDGATARDGEPDKSEAAVTESPTGDVQYDPAALKDVREKMGRHGTPGENSETSEGAEEVLTESPTGDVRYDPAALKDVREKMGRS